MINCCTSNKGGKFLIPINRQTNTRMYHHKIVIPCKRPTRNNIFQITLRAMVILMIILQNIDRNVEAKASPASKKTLKLLKSSSSLIQLRHKRDTFNADQQEQPFANDDFYDDNYDVIPDMTAGGSPTTLDDQISEGAKEIAQTFTNMWQTIVESIKECVEAIRSIFEEDELTAEQEEELRVAMEQQQQAKNIHDNEIFMNVYENQL